MEVVRVVTRVGKEPELAQGDDAFDERSNAEVLAEALICEEPESGMTPERFEERLVALGGELELTGEVRLDDLRDAFLGMQDLRNRRLSRLADIYIDCIERRLGCGTMLVELPRGSAS